MMRLTLAALLLPVFALIGTAQTSPRELFERARMIEETNSKLAEAIGIYTQVASQSADRQLAATAQLRVGLVHERMGHKEDAIRAFNAVITHFSDFPDVVRQARARVPAARAAADLPFGARRVWSGPDAQFFGSPSPDGRYMSFVDWTTGDLAIRDLIAGTSRRLTTDSNVTKGGNAYAYYSRIAPDGNSVAYAWITGLGSELRLVRLDGGTASPTVLYRNPDVDLQPFDWLPDGRELVVGVARRDRTKQIALFSLRDSSLRVLKSLEWRYPTGMSVSRDGRWIAYDAPQRDRAGERDVYALAIDGSREHTIVAHDADDMMLGWMADGSRLLFASDRTGSMSAWTVSVTDGRPSGPAEFLRSDLGSRAYPLGFTRSGSFYYFSVTGTSSIYTATLEHGASASPVPMQGRLVIANAAADWSPDGSLAIASDRAGHTGRVLTIRPSTGEAERILQPDIGFFSKPRWSPDGKSILVSGRDGRARPGFFVVDASTGGVRELHRTDTDARALRPEWSPDGRSLFYVRKTADCACVVKRAIADGEEIEIFRMPPSDRQVTLAVSGDGRHVAMLHNATGSPALTVAPTTGGQPRTILEASDLAWFNFVAWTPAGDVLFGRHHPSSADVVEMWRIATDGGKPVKTVLAMEGLRDVRVHPDGRRVVFTAGRDKPEVWVMENLPSPARSTSGAARR